MKSAGAFYVKTHLSALLEEVQQGEVIEITNRGKPVARIVPLKEGQRQREIQEAVEGLRKLERIKLPKGVSIRSLLDEARRLPTKCTRIAHQDRQDI